MEFFDREQEMKKLKAVWDLSHQTAQFTVVTGRRRIGKTSLILKSLEATPFLYFFVSRKAEAELCQGYVAEIEEKLGIPMLGDVFRFPDLFEYVMKLSCQRHITLVIDEFQEFYKVNKSVYSDMQRIWDIYKPQAHVNLIVCGSVNTLMNKIFRDQKEALYGRHTQQMKIGNFRPSVLKDILHTYAPSATSEDLLALYLFTGGVAKYVELLIDGGHFTADAMLKAVTAQDSLFLDEGKASLVEEFGKDYGIYFTILSLIAQGHNTRSDIEGMLKQEIGGYLSRLLDDYELIAKRQPLFERSANKGVRYAIKDHFLRFWFRFIYKYNYMIEIGANDKLRAIIQRDYETYSGQVLEQFFRERLMELGEYTCIGSWHDRRGENEIDIIAANDLAQTVDFFEVKRNSRNIDLAVLRSKADTFLNSTGRYLTYEKDYHALSMDDM